ncbi:unnamed protein product [Citrullus colocynthis]|uniref:Uncharacterized protein n=1 Tax=Citrullus colocynthis TaxID=252529 RepID=A0ABP0XXF4_9ROSI
MSLALEKSIRKLLHQQAPCDKAKWIIYRVPKQLLYMNYKAYIPEVITIGPFHHYKKDSMATQALKPLCFNAYLHRTNLKVEGILAMAKSWEKEARCCYAQPINKNSYDFVKMMLLDGCFIVELLIKINTKSQPCDDQTNIPNIFDKSFNAMWYDMYHAGEPTSFLRC